MTTSHPNHQRPRNAQHLLIQAVCGLQRLAFEKAQQETHTLNVEPRHAPLLRAAAEQSAPFRVRVPQLSTVEGA